MCTSGARGPSGTQVSPFVHSHNEHEDIISYLSGCPSLLTVGALLMELLFASLAAVAQRRPPGGRALASVQLPGAMTRHRPVLLVR